MSVFRETENRLLPSEETKAYHEQIGIRPALSSRPRPPCFAFRHRVDAMRRQASGAAPAPHIARHTVA